MIFEELLDKLIIIITVVGIFGAFSYLDGKAKAKKKFRKPKYKQYKLD